VSWHRVLDAEQLEQATPTAIQLQGREICVLRLAQDIHAFDDACPHRQWPLHLGQLKDGILTCRAHTWEWDVRTGELQRMRAPECLTMHEARERDSAIEIRLDPGTPEPLPISALWRATQELEDRSG
jgi:nitrite reductase/ring-hydroxylating ferredoxin subunit